MTEIYTQRHNRFSGKIYIADFCTSEPRGNYASRVANDLKFDQKCKRNEEFRTKLKKGNR